MIFSKKYLQSASYLRHATSLYYKQVNHPRVQKLPPDISKKSHEHTHYPNCKVFTLIKFPSSDKASGLLKMTWN